MNMTYKEALTGAMNELAADPLVRFIGYGVKHGGQAGGTLKGANPAQLVETPVAENLMAGLAIGMSLAGLRPVVYFERFDFVLNALDAIVNHLDKIGPMSGGQFRPAVILRVVVGNQHKPLYTGATHTQDFTEAVRRMVNFPVVTLPGAKPEFVTHAYALAHRRMALESPAGYLPESTMLVEYKDFL